MQHRRLAALLIAVMLVLELLALSKPASASPPIGRPDDRVSAAAKPKTGRLTVKIGTPKGVPATVRVVRGTGKRYLSKSTAGTTASRSLTLAAGSYKIEALPTVYGGRIYGPKKTTVKVKVKKGKTAKKTVSYRLLDTARDLTVVKVKTTSIQLRWTAPKKGTVQLRMVAGTVAARTPSSGASVAIARGGVTRTGLKPGQVYTFSIFTKVGTKWLGPVTRTITTTPPAGSAAVAYAATPSTIIAKPGQVAAVPTVGGVSASVPSGLVPTVGQVFVLPGSARLPGGFIGKVAAISANGRTVALKQTSMAEAFDAYVVNLSSFTGKPIPLTPDTTKAGQQQLQRNSVDRPTTERTGDGAPGKVRGAATAKDCLGGTFTAGVVKLNAPAIVPSGSFSYSIDKKNVFGLAIPTGAQVGTELKFKVTQTMNVDVEGSLSCGIPFKPIVYPLPITSPVPMVLYFTPTFQTSVTGQLKFDGIGVTVTNGFWAKGKIGLTSGLTVQGGPIFTAAPILKAPTLGKGKIESTLGVEFVLGPGMGSPDIGLVAGLNGKVNLINASLGTAYPQGDPRFGNCFKAALQFSAEAGLSAKVWAGNWDANAKATVPLGGPVNLMAPKYIPDGCTALPDPGADVIGPGVTKTSDAITGSTEQWGKTDAFTTGTPAWILSTGRMANINGTASDFATTSLGLVGDPRLTELAGFDTFDAAAYTAKIIPQGNTLHVRYIFASEEYPDFIGTKYNDVMAVYVNGVNCATVAGEPVSVNTVNSATNSELYIANDGTKPTSMNGYTVPMQCDVPVTPGVPATVQVAVADTSDGSYDSAVGLLEQGIWSD